MTLQRPLEQNESKLSLESEAISEALDQIMIIADAEEDRRKAADAKIAAASSAIGYIVTISSGAIALAFGRTSLVEGWQLIVFGAFFVALIFFVKSAFHIVKANDPIPFQARTATSVRALVFSGASKRELQMDAINDLISIIAFNAAATDVRLTSYCRAAIESIRLGVVFAAIAPAVLLLAIASSKLFANAVPGFLRAPAALTSSASTSSPLPTSSTTITQPDHSKGVKTRPAAPQATSVLRN